MLAARLTAVTDHVVHGLAQAGRQTELEELRRQVIGERAILIRGVLLKWLRAWMTDGSAIVLSALLFALWHPHYGPMMSIMFSHGLVLAWARIKSGGLLVPILLHVLINGVASLVALI